MSQDKRRSPESVEWDTLKGRRIGVLFRGADAAGEMLLWTGKLIWVDHYTFCMERDLVVRVVPGPSTVRVMVFKSDVRAIWAEG